jgi:hypothetical protein
MMKMMMLAGAAGVAALAAAAPASAQYYPGYSYGAPYGNAYGYYNNNSQVLAQRCAAAVQQRLSYRSYRRDSSDILGALFGINTRTQGRVLNVTQVNPNRSTVRVRGLATSGRAMAYNPYGAGYYGATGYAYQPDLTFKCDIDYRGVVRDIDINRR